jgi:hypothetical protein
MFKKFFNDIFTGRDNVTYDIGRVLWFKAVCAFILISAYEVYRGVNIDMIAWGTGLAALLGGGGAAIGMKSSTEPDSLPPANEKQ